MTTIKENLENIRIRAQKAAINAGRDPLSIRLVAVSKRIDISAIKEAYNAGQTIFGESYLQEAKDKIETFRPAGAEWHFIGHIQSNKAKDIVSCIDMVHTLDSLKLAKALNRYAAEKGKKLAVLIQVNVGEELQKSGVLPRQADELVCSLQQLSNLKLSGLMTMPPYKSNQEEVRPYFHALREMAEKFASQGYFHNNEQYELSMGMSGDFEVAIEEGATLIRIGTAIFGNRSPRP